MTEKKYNVVVVGATGVVGKDILKILHERKFPVGKIAALASSDSLGKKVEFADKDISVEAVEGFDFTGYDIGLFSPGAEISAKYAPKAVESGCIVVDNTSHFRMDKDIALVVPEVNPETIDFVNKRKIVANPNCTTIQLVLVLKALEQLSLIKSAVISTYQSVSGAGRDAMDELYRATKNKYMNMESEGDSIFPKPITFNIIPQIGDFSPNGYTDEELKIMLETKKIMGSEIEVSATCVRVPVFIGHSEAVTIRFAKKDNLSVAAIHDVLRNFAGIKLIDELKAGGYATPLDAVRGDDVLVSRVRKDLYQDDVYHMWIVADNLRKGAALNAVQIAEMLIKKGYC